MTDLPTPPGLARRTGPTARLLHSAAPTEALWALIQAGGFDPSQLLDPDEYGRPGFQAWALAHRIDASPDETPWPVASPWPTDPSMAWTAAMAPPLPASTQPQAALAMRDEFVAAWCISQAPHGLGSARWPVGGTPPGQAGMLSVAVFCRWAKVAAQLLARRDAPKGAGIDALITPMPVFTHLFGANRHGRGPGADPGSSCLPLLHCALERNDLSLARALLAAGANPNLPAHDLSTPLYFARSSEAVDLLLERGARLEPAGHGAGMDAWWSDVLGSATAAAPLAQRVNAWVVRTQSPQQVLALKLPQLARIMAQGTASALRQQATQLKVPVDVRWSERGRQWGWVTSALEVYLQAGPDPARPPPAGCQWAADRTDPGPDLLDDVPNTHLMAFIATAHPGLDQVCRRRHGEVKLDAPALSRIVAALRTWVPGPLRMRKRGREHHPDATRQQWLLHAATLAGQMGATDVVAQAWEGVDMRHALPLAPQAMRQALLLARHDPERALEWADHAVVLYAASPMDKVASSMNGASAGVEDVLSRECLGWGADAPTDKHLPGIALAHALTHLPDAPAPAPPARSKRVEQALALIQAGGVDRISHYARFNTILSGMVRRARLGATLPEAAAAGIARPRSRM